MTSLTSLPNELLLKILQFGPDLASIYALVCTHRLFAELFDLDSIRILQQVIRNSLSRLFQDFPVWIAILGSIRTPESIYNPSKSNRISWVKFFRRYTELHAVNKKYLTPELLPSLVGTTGPRYALCVAARVQKLEDICLIYMLNQVGSMIHEPLRDETVLLQPACASEEVAFTPDFKTAASWAPSWVERHRVNYGLWQLMTSWTSDITFEFPEGSDLPPQHIGAARIRSRDWRSTFIVHPHFHAGFIRRSWHKPCLTGGVFDNVHQTLFKILECSPFDFFTSQVLPAQKATAEKNLATVQNLVLARVELNPEWRHEVKPMDDEQGEILGQSRNCFRYPNYAMKFLLTRYCRHRPNNSPSTYDLRAFSSLALAIWDTKRLASMGLAALPTFDHRSRQVVIDLDVWEQREDDQRRIWQNIMSQALIRVKKQHSSSISNECRLCNSVKHEKKDCWFRHPYNKSYSGVGVSRGEIVLSYEFRELQHVYELDLEIHDVHVRGRDRIMMKILVDERRRPSRAVAYWRRKVRENAEILGSERNHHAVAGRTDSAMQSRWMFFYDAEDR